MQDNEYKTTGQCSTGQTLRLQGQCHESSRDIMGVAGILWVPTMHSTDILLQAKGDHLDRVHSDQMVLRMTRRGRLVR